MSDSKTELQTAIYGALDGQVTRGGKAIPVKDKFAIPSDVSYPHIMIGDWTEIPWDNKTNTGDEDTINIVVFDRQKGNMGSRADLYDISGQVKSILRQRPSPITLNDHQLVCMTFDSSTSLEKQQGETHILFGESLTFRMLVRNR